MNDFKNRLAKVNKHIAKWAKRNNITCYRIYDWDIPGHPLVIDKYGPYVHVAEYKTRNPLSEEQYAIWWDSCMEAIIEILEVDSSNIYTKQRQKLDRRQVQYDKFSEQSFITWQEESGLLFKLNLTDYLDTGLFLDHRPLRQVVRGMSAGKRVLNLFSYTGSFSVYAAAGGATRVTTVDLSNTYINWAKENLKKNGFEPAAHQFVVSDVMQFLKDDQQYYDLVIVDPPSFSNSKKMKGTWDTQRDHRKMLLLIYDRLAPGATVFFSNNFRNFTPDMERLPYRTIQEITHKTIPEDYRNKKIHRCFELAR